jgi:hypothetical protein
VHLGVDQKVIAIGINPHHLGLRATAWQQGGERREVLSTGQLEDHRMKLTATRLVRHVFASSIYRSRRPFHETFFRFTSGYARRFPLEGASDLLLATHIGNEEFYAGRGFPSRLVAPSHRGYGWVKWIAEVVSHDPAWLELLPPLQ